MYDDNQENRKMRELAMILSGGGAIPNQDIKSMYMDYQFNPMMNMGAPMAKNFSSGMLNKISPLLGKF